MMKRREFLRACMFTATGWLVSTPLSLLGFDGSCRADEQPASIGDSPIPEKKSDVLENFTNGRMILRNGSHQQIILNPVGLIIWKNIDGKNTCDQIARLVSQEFDINFESALNDVNEYVLGLQKEGFLDINKIARCRVISKTVALKKPSS